MTNASKYGILMHSVDNFIQVTVVRDTKEAAMSLLQSVLLGLIQGLTEFLPVSSSGHLAIFKQFFQIETGGMFFDILLHIGTLIAVFIVYYKDIFRMIKEGFAIIGDSFVNDKSKYLTSIGDSKHGINDGLYSLFNTLFKSKFSQNL